jgi:hypothetical protein
MVEISVCIFFQTKEMNDAVRRKIVVNRRSGIPTSPAQLIIPSYHDTVFSSAILNFCTRLSGDHSWVLDF